MRRTFQGSSIYQSTYLGEEDADPRVGLVNLADVMLVFACGLMIALVSHWNVNLSAVASVDEAGMEEIDNVEEMIDGMKSGNQGYDERGKVYQDPETGQLYLLEKAQTGQGGKSGSDAQA